MEFSQILVRLMDERGYTNYRLAKLLDCSQSTVASWVNGNSIPSRSRKKQLSELFQVSVDFLEGNEKPAPKNEDGLTASQKELIRILPLLSDYEVSVLLATAQSLISGRTLRDGL